MWAIKAQIEHVEHDALTGVWTSTIGVPTFYLHESVQGIRDEAHAISIAAEIIDPCGFLVNNGDTVHITAVKVKVR